MTAWQLTKRCLVVSARLKHDQRDLLADDFEDGCRTRAGTFQKFYEQGELRAWIDASLGTRSVSAAPGICYVFRDDANRESFLASRCRRTAAAPALRKSDDLFERHRPLFESLMAFVTDRGRLPELSEIPEGPAIAGAAGSLKRAFRVVKIVTSDHDWARIRDERAEDLLVHMALSKFHGRPPLRKLPSDLQLDIKAFFKTYKAAIARADQLLFSAGNMDRVDQAARKSSVGKLTANSFYVHKAALPLLVPILRVYEGCARAYIGEVEGANIIKLHRRKPKISYLSYPSFDSDPHPALRESHVVSLTRFTVRVHDYRDSENPFILHRKELFVPSDYPGRGDFEQLTRDEETRGLYSTDRPIGTRADWEALLLDSDLGRAQPLEDHGT